MLEVNEYFNFNKQSQMYNWHTNSSKTKLIETIVNAKNIGSTRRQFEIVVVRFEIL